MPIISGCSLGYEVQSLNDYFLSSKYVQEQNSSTLLGTSLNSDFNQSGEGLSWVSAHYPKACEWYDYDRTVDGDTIIVRDGPEVVRVRMVGIDTPESKKAGTPIEPFALEASGALEALLEGEAQLCLIADGVGDKIDTYGRTLAYVFRGDGLDVNAQMIKDGWAEAYTRFPMERGELFEGLEKAAREQGLGRWQ